MNPIIVKKRKKENVNLCDKKYITHEQYERKKDKIFLSFLSQIIDCKENEINSEVLRWVKDCTERILKQYGHSISIKEKEHPCLQADNCEYFKNNTCTLLEDGKCKERKECHL